MNGRSTGGWVRKWLISQKTSEQIEKVVRASKELKESQEQIVSEVPEARHVVQNWRMITQAFIQRLEKPPHG